MPDRRPNILLITSDHTRWDTIAGRSVCRTPHMNRLAEEGVLFDRSYTPISLCCPARAMLVSGAYPWHNGVYHQVHEHDLERFARDAQQLQVGRQRRTLLRIVESGLRPVFLEVCEPVLVLVQIGVAGVVGIEELVLVLDQVRYPVQIPVHVGIPLIWLLRWLLQGDFAVSAI